MCQSKCVLMSTGASALVLFVVVLVINFNKPQYKETQIQEEFKVSDTLDDSYDIQRLVSGEDAIETTIAPLDTETIIVEDVTEGNPCQGGISMLLYAMLCK